MDKLLIGRYIQGDSFVHKLDPRTKLLISFFFIFLIFFVNTWPAYGVIAIFIFLALSASGISLHYFWNGIKPMIWIILFTVVLQVIFTTGGVEYFHWGFIRITSEGIVNGVFIFLRFVSIIVLSTILTLTTAPLALTDAIESLCRPLKRLKFPVDELALMLSIALRFVPTLMDEAVKIMNAQKARGVEFNEGSILQKIKAIIPILIPLFVSSFNRAEDLAIAMEARGYQGSEHRSKYRLIQYGRRDALAAFIFFCLIAALVTVNILF